MAAVNCRSEGRAFALIATETALRSVLIDDCPTGNVFQGRPSPFPVAAGRAPVADKGRLIVPGCVARERKVARALTRQDF